MPSRKRILVAEDDPVCRRFVELSLQTSGFSVLAAEPNEARRLLEQQGAKAFGCLVVCYNHAQDGGLELVEWASDQDATLAAIVVGAALEGRPEKSLRGGACDFLEKPLNCHSLRNAVARGVAATGQRRGLSDLHRGAQAAGQIQKTLLASVLSGTSTPVESYFRPKQQAGGDFLAHYQLAGGEDILLLTDVSGHDLEAAVMSALFHGMARGLIDSGVAVEDVLSRYNQVLLTTPGFDKQPSSIAVCCLRLDRQRGVLQAFLAGSPPPRWVGPDGWIEDCAAVVSTPLGWFAESRPAVLTVPLPTQPVWLWTDGVEDVAAQLGADPCSVAAALLQAAHTNTEPDWITDARDDVLVVRVCPALSPDQPVVATTPLIAARYRREQALEIDTLQAVWARSLDLAVPDLHDNTRFDVLLCAREAVLNAILHGCQDDGEATLQVVWLPATRELRVLVRDPGPGYEVADTQMETDELSDGHRGLILMRHLTSGMCISERGTRITMSFKENDQQL